MGHSRRSHAYRIHIVCDVYRIHIVTSRAICIAVYRRIYEIPCDVCAIVSHVSQSSYTSHDVYATTTSTSHTYRYDTAMCMRDHIQHTRRVRYVCDVVRIATIGDRTNIACISPQFQHMVSHVCRMCIANNLHAKCTRCITHEYRVRCVCDAGSYIYRVCVTHAI
jgi:hypothetical protein